jgi:murein DD-endopeptidase MepM/ murein hydrolase activator NlpD
MAWKVADYNTLRREVETLRNRYQTLEKESKQKGAQLASLQLLANEVSIAYGLTRSLEGPLDIADEGRLLPTLNETLEQYNFLKSASLSGWSRRTSPLFRGSMMPAIWPVDGRLMSHFGRRSDPFSGEGAFHAGVDISAARGTPIKATASGIVTVAAWAGDYGRLVIIDHGNGFQTYYAHLSRVDVIEGQTIRVGDSVGKAGATGRATSSHLHYEVRRRHIPVNPYQYMRSTFAKAPQGDHFGL